MQILDGGTGRQLKRIGAPFRQPEWSALALIESPGHVLQVHQDFIDAGAHIITTNSYAVVPFHIGPERFHNQAADLLQLAGRLAVQGKQSAGRPVTVAAGIPPLFGSYVPNSFDPVKAIPMLHLFRDNLLPHGDLVLAETLSCIAEIRAFQEVFADCGKPVWASLSLDDESPENGAPKLRSGEPLELALDVAQRHTLDALLFNCSQPEVMADGIAIARKTLDPGISIGVYANAFPSKSTTTGLANQVISDIRPDLTPQKYRDFALHWQSLGATIIGGCCGIGPEHIKAISGI